MILEFIKNIGDCSISICSIIVLRKCHEFFPKIVTGLNAIKNVIAPGKSKLFRRIFIYIAVHHLFCRYAIHLPAEILDQTTEEFVEDWILCSDIFSVQHSTLATE